MIVRLDRFFRQRRPRARVRIVVAGISIKGV
jgi:hypothetical protein